ncbi:amidohydrolase family protein [uncultured Litoreibacter sp.]|uniref:amidohydrolase family protein n=1 Tax=uncultured Litoreibacter sp. TaxID=1392394 RepID=UPI00261C1C6E|nr:amidohydrolase family protein [uncultured Litoreibacter sp.]
MTTHFPITDAHVHVFAPEKYPLDASRSYTPGPANVADLANHLGRIGGQNAVIVQPSPHGTDNRPTLRAVSERGQDCTRGVCVISPASTSKEDLDALWGEGIRGLRANLKTAGVNAIEDVERQLQEISRTMAGTDLMLQVFLPIKVTIAMAETFKSLGRPVILDHFAGLKTSSPTRDEELAGLLEVLSLPNVILKASGACRAIDYASTTSALDDVAPTLFAAARGRVIWGSDWPHTGKSSERAQRPLSEIEPFMAIDDNASLDNIRKWSGNDSIFQEITSDTANSLFGF